jgi:hypothetical protein
MYLIGQVTSDAFQQQNLTLQDGSTVLFQMYYRSMQFGWFISRLVYNPVTASYGAPSNYNGPFTINGLRITNSPNMLNQWVNQIPFGLACISPSQREPTQLQDFSTGASNLYILTQAECQQYVQFLQSGSLL